MDKPTNLLFSFAAGDHHGNSSLVFYSGCVQLHGGGRHHGDLFMHQMFSADPIGHSVCVCLPFMPSWLELSCRMYPITGRVQEHRQSFLNIKQPVTWSCW